MSALGHKQTFHTLTRHDRFSGRNQTSRRDRLNVGSRYNHLRLEDVPSLATEILEGKRVGKSSLIFKAGRASDVDFGSLADIAARARHVRLTPDSGHSSVADGISEKCHYRTFEMRRVTALSCPRISQFSDYSSRC